IKGNVIANNKVGLFFDMASGDYRGNLIAYNDLGIQLLASARHNQFGENSFIDNAEDVTVDGTSISESTNIWKENFWSDYQGFDQNKDGLGDIPYQPVELFERLIMRYPALKLFLMSPSKQALDFASSAFPIFAPRPKFEDHSPRMEPIFPSVPKGTQGFSLFWMIVSGVLLVPPLGFSVGAGKKKRLWYNARAVFGGKPVNLRIVQDHEAVIHVSNLTKHFGKVKALDQVSFNVKQGEAVALWGPNGAGKTTLLRSLLGILPSEGAQNILGFDVLSQGKDVRRNVGYVPQEIRLHTDQSVLETVAFYAQLRNVPLDQAERLMEDWGLGGRKSHEVHTLSGGMKQKLALVIALLSDPPILFLDEPTSNLDVYVRSEFYTRLAHLKEAGKTMLFCTHRFSEVLKLADRVVVLKAGRKVNEGKPDEVKDFLTGETVLCVTVSKKDSEAAYALMARHGISAKQDGTQLWIQTPSARKAEPFRLLLDAHIQVLDFELEDEPASPFARKEEP
ncbi:MAG: ATP-binding cassette domain-containing protein, partial [Candidatus Omnitrophica bacterium]|nr:ATP-binding cassette domain-containing protein [Candidatus Omnitrophota bacterium]